MLSVFTLCTGDKYAEEYVHRLKRAVERHLEQPHRFVCLSDREISGINTAPPPCDYPGWWGKVGLFAFTGRCLWLDLDVVVTGGLDDLCQTEADLRCGKNWAQSGHGGCQSSVMYWENARIIDYLFDYELRGDLWGDQEWITQLRDQRWIKVDYYDPAHLRSYKYHCRSGLPPDTRVVAFHGKPDPHEVADPWVAQHWI